MHKIALYFMFTHKKHALKRAATYMITRKKNLRTNSDQIKYTQNAPKCTSFQKFSRCAAILL